MIADAEWSEFASVELDDAFIESYIRNGETARASSGDDASRNESLRSGSASMEEILGECSMQSVCDGFVRNFLTDDTMGTLHYLLKDCDSSLKDIADILHRFISSLDTTRQGIEDVRQQLHRVMLQHGNATSAGRAVRTVLQRLLVSPQVVRIITQGGEEELGPQFKHSVQELLCILRKSRRYTNILLVKEDSGCYTAVPAGASAIPVLADAGNRETVQVPLLEFKMYHEQIELLNRLTVLACTKAKRFLAKKIALLSVKNTNVSIQQEHILKPTTFYSRLIDEAVTLLCPSNVGDMSNQTNPESPASLPYCIVKALHSELRRDYYDIMSKLYLERICHYVMTLNLMENTASTANKTAPHKVSAVPWVNELPLITDDEAPSSQSAFELGERAVILQNVFAPPLVPTVEQAKWRLHSYEETFRSLNILLCDAVTHEFIFTFTFFSGDMSVFVDVFKPTIQFIVDYVAEVLLAQNTNNGVWRGLHEQYPQTAVNTVCGNDCYGLLILIRLCHDFNSLMKDVRRLCCLEGFYDSLLLQLWPSFQQTFERQVRALRLADVPTLADSFLRAEDKQGVSDWVARIHPLIKHYAAFTKALVTITSGCGFNGSDTEEGYAKATALANQSVQKDNADGNGATASGTTGVGGDGNKNISSEDDVGFEELQQIAWRIIEEERASDMADSSSRFAVLAGNLSFLRVEVERLLCSVTAQLLETSRCDPDQREHRNLAFLQNNVRYILNEWQEAIRNGGAPMLGPDYSALEELEKTLRSGLVLSIMKHHFPLINRVLQNDEHIDVLAVAEVFHHKWRIELEELCRNVRSLLRDEKCKEELLAQVCTEVLLWNTRFIACLSKATDDAAASGVSTPSSSCFTVTNQQMIQHIRTLAAIAESKDDDEEG